MKSVFFTTLSVALAFTTAIPVDSINDDVRLSIAKPFTFPNDNLLMECRNCERASQCSTNKCWGGRCVFDTTASKEKCFHQSGVGPISPGFPRFPGFPGFPIFPSRGLSECSSCSSSRACSTNKCWGGKCVFGTQASRDRCFSSGGGVSPLLILPSAGLPECSRCTTSLSCSTRNCWGGKCVFDTKRSKNRCFSGIGTITPHLILPGLGLPDCSFCSFSSECVSENCWEGRCQPKFGRARCGFHRVPPILLH